MESLKSREDFWNIHPILYNPSLAQSKELPFIFATDSLDQLLVEATVDLVAER